MALRLQLTFGDPPAAPAERTLVRVPPAAAWPFVYPITVDRPAVPAVVLVPDLHEAFINHQREGSRLVTTQATYLMVAWSDVVGERDVVMLASADRQSLERHAPEILDRRGVFSDIDIVSEGGRATGARGATGAPLAPLAPLAPALTALISAIRTDDPRERLALCIRALDQDRSPGTLLATASACMEVNDLDAARRVLEEALARAPEWAAAHFESGKLWLRLDDMERASESFRAAAQRLPRFGSAWSNLGATLGELDRPDDALEAFTRALACDPSSPQTHNNIGVVCRELGRLADSEAAFRRVIALASDLAFGYYNLGHTLFLEGRYQAALGAYREGQKRDPELNPVQASRLAMCRLATGDALGAITELQRATSALPRDYRRQLLADTQSLALALLTHRADLAGWQHVSDWLTREMGS